MKNIHLYVNYVEKERSFLKIWGHLGRPDYNPWDLFEECIDAVYRRLPESNVVLPDDLYVDQILCAKYKNKYYRVKVNDLSRIEKGLVEVRFIDHGNKDYLPFMDLYRITKGSKTLFEVPPKVSPFILANIAICPEAADDVLLTVSNEIMHTKVDGTVLAHVGPAPLIQLNGKGGDLVTNLISKQLCVPVKLETQQLILEWELGGGSCNTTRSQLPVVGQNTPNLTPVQNPLNTPTPNSYCTQLPKAPIIQNDNLPDSSINLIETTDLLSYKTKVPDPGTEHVVNVSYVSDGPLLFFVQLEKMEQTLTELMYNLNQMSLEPLEGNVMIGTICIAKRLEDGSVCRGVITDIVDSLFKVFLIDYGITELVPLENIFVAPHEFVIPKEMAKRFALAGFDKTNVTKEMKSAFKEFVSNRRLTMRLTPTAKNSVLPTCELWDENGVNAAHILKQTVTQLLYPDPVILNPRLSQNVRVSCVFSCNKFFVQLKNKTEELDLLMVELLEIYPKLPPVQRVKEGAPCCAFNEADGLWYRAQVLRAEGGRIRVKYVDYGNEETVIEQNLRNLMSEHVTGLQPQALECGLYDYQYAEVDKERDSLFKKLIIGKNFYMKVVYVQEDNRALVELFDSVTSLLNGKYRADSSSSNIEEVFPKGEVICEHCGTAGLRAKFKKNERFCSDACFKKYVPLPRRNVALQGNKNKWDMNNRKEVDAEIGAESSPSSNENAGDKNDGPKVDPSKWTIVEVYDFILSLPGCLRYAENFLIEEIDGQALMQLKADHLVTAMSMKWDLALKIVAKINDMRIDRKTPKQN